jgi:5-hydroxyisourate hydrolase
MISTHVLDTSRGHPAANVAVTLESVDATGASRQIGQYTTDGDGRVRELISGGALGAGTYRLTFDTGAYARSLGLEAFYPSVVIVFVVADPTQHYHVPLLFSPYGYVTYRGS